MAKDKEHFRSVFLLCENEKLVSPKDGKTFVGTARFLKPRVQTLSEAATVPNTPLLFEIFSENLKTWPENVEIKGWHVPQKQWEDWVDRMAGKHGALWNLTGICDSIMSSRYELRCNKDLLLGLVEFWCPETNTFVFPWGEATVTLEDVMILGGFSVLGESVTRPLDGKLVEIEEAMNKKRSILTRSKSKKASHGIWMKHFKREEEREYEHVAFLSLWLSRYVFPSLPEKVVSKQVFPVAIHLSSNTKVALAPAVLASLYKNLTLLKNQAISSRQEIMVSGPLRLLQLWAFERFPSLGPQIPNALNPGEPRAARFHRLNAKVSLPLVESVLRLADNFRWRPYIAYLKNWVHPSYYNDARFLTLACKYADEDRKSFARCLHCSVLVGIDCKEEYLPHRVAMQFGFDQDLPAAFPVSSISWENAMFAVPPRSFKPCVSVRYMNWWKKSESARKTALRDIKRNQNTSSSVLAKTSVEKSPPREFGVKKPRISVSKPLRKAENKECCSSFATVLDYSDEHDFPMRPQATIQKIIEPHISPTGGVERAKINSNGSPSMSSLKSTCSISQVSADNKSQESHVSVDPEFSSKVKRPAYEDYDDPDDIPLSERLKHVLGTPSRRAVFSKASPRCQIRTTDSPTSRAPIVYLSKSMFSSTAAGRGKASTLPFDRIAEAQMNSPPSGVPNVCLKKRKFSSLISGKRKATTMPSDQKLKRTAREWRKALYHENDATDVSEHRMKIEQKKRFEGSVKGTGIESKTRLGGEVPKSSDNVTFKETTAGSIQNFGQELEGRLRRLEKATGITG